MWWQKKKTGIEKMKEISRIIIVEYCQSHKTKKAKNLERLVEMSYDLYCEGTDYDAIILDDLIDRKRNDELKKAIEDLRDFIFPP